MERDIAQSGISKEKFQPTPFDQTAYDSGYGEAAEKTIAREQFKRGLHGALARRIDGEDRRRIKRQYAASKGDRRFQKIVDGDKVVYFIKANGKKTLASGDNKQQFEADRVREKYLSGLDEYFSQEDQADVDGNVVDGSGGMETVFVESQFENGEFIAEQEPERNWYDDLG